MLIIYKSYDPYINTTHILLTSLPPLLPQNASLSYYLIQKDNKKTCKRTLLTILWMKKISTLISVVTCKLLYQLLVAVGRLVSLEQRNIIQLKTSSEQKHAMLYLLLVWHRAAWRPTPAKQQWYNISIEKNIKQIFFFQVRPSFAFARFWSRNFITNSLSTSEVGPVSIQLFTVVVGNLHLIGQEFNSIVVNLSALNVQWTPASKRSPGSFL